jgi:hypothetical protein
MRLVCSLLPFFLAFFFVVGPARAETLEAPAGGAAFELGEGRVICTAPGGWTIEQAGRKARPPTAASPGTSVDLSVAAAQADCARKSVAIHVVVTAGWPELDPTSVTLALDEGRLRLRGRNLSGVSISWPAAQGLGQSTCHDPKPEGSGAESCTWNVPKTLSSDPTANSLRWWPAGAQVATDAVLFGADGKRAATEGFGIAPARVELTDILPPDTSIDVSSGLGRAVLAHPEAVASVECSVVHCSVESGVLLVSVPPPAVSAIDVKFHLAPRAYYVRRSPPETQPVLHISILRCPMTVVSGLPLRGVDVRVVVRIEGACMRDIGGLNFLSGAQKLDVVDTATTPEAAYALLELGTVRSPEISIAAIRGDPDGPVVALAKVETQVVPVVRTTLEIAGVPPIDFIPNNRRAIVHVPHVAGAELVLLGIPDVYEANVEDGLTTVRGDVNAVGLVALQFGYRVRSLPHPFDEANLAILSDTLQRGVKEANLPAPLGKSAFEREPLVEVLCSEENGLLHTVIPGVVLRLPFSARFGCRVVFHRERLSSEYGTQKLALEIDVEKVEGGARPESHVSETIVLRNGSEPRIAWIKGVASPYDRIVVRLSHVADEAHYLGALDIATGAPGVQWTTIFGTGRVRLYATTAIPTGLYRFGTKSTSGALSLSLGVLSRFTWLDSDGHEGLLGLEAGLMAFGLTGDVSATNESLTQVGAVVGLGVSIPIANAGAPTQASINLHGWFEQRIAGSGGEASSQQAVIFGPSISIGNVGTTF